MGQAADPEVGFFRSVALADGRLILVAARAVAVMDHSCSLVRGNYSHHG